MDSTNVSFTDMEIDTIGEILNISMGAAATAVSTLLNKKVYITTPKVEVTTSGNFEFKALAPGVGVEINYIEGLSGVNVFVLKKEDIQKIVSILLQTEYNPNEEFIMDEISISAICETMNQMMGSSSTALAQFLNRTVNISTPTPFEVTTDENFSRKYFNEDDDILAVKFNINVEGVLDSEFASVMSLDFAKELISSLFSSQNNEDPAVEPVVTPEPVAVPVQQQAQQHAQQPTQKPSNQSYAQQENYDISSASFHGFEKGQVEKLEERPENLKLIMSVPLKITVELGHSKKSIKDILEFANGSIIELNKQAGMPVDILVNGQKIAKGDVVVVEEYYGVRITEILNPNEIIKVL